jgi:cytochrome c-type biogenesis protein CcmH
MAMKAFIQSQEGRQKFGKLMLGLLAAICLAGGAYHLVRAQTPVAPTPSDDQVNAIARQFYCPVCANTPLDVCATTECAQWRDLIRQKLAAGWSEAQIKDYFVQQYGDRVLPEPPARGFNWLIYILPPVAILIGAYVVYLALRGTHKPQPDTAPASPATPPAGEQPDDYLARVEADLKKRT